MNTGTTGSADPKVFLRIGSHAEKEYFQKVGRFFDGLILGANLFESTPWASAGLLLSLSMNRRAIPYFIDPMTYGFGGFTGPDGNYHSNLDWLHSEDKNGKPQLKRSYRLLSEALGEPFSTACKSRRALTTSDFASAATVKQACRSVMSYQYNRVEGLLKDDPDYKSLATSELRPAGVFAPYLYIDKTDLEKSSELAVRFATVAATERIDGTGVQFVLCADSTLLENTSILNATIAGLKASGIDMVWLWISALNEESADLRTLEAFRDACVSLSEGVRVGNLHGGYLSLALSFAGLSTTSHSVGYGEQKDITPIIGQTIPTVRYYLPPLHRRLGVPEIERSFKPLGIESVQDFHSMICQCAICKGVLSSGLKAFSQFGDMYFTSPDKKKKAQTPAAAKLCRFHYLLSRVEERDHIRGSTKTDILAELRSARVIWEKSPTLADHTRHLERWITVLSR